MATENRREREKRERRESILDAAEKVFFDKGFERCSMDDIARTAQLSRALLYVYFKDKTEIMRGIMVRAAEMLVAGFAAATRAGDTGMQQICNIGQAYYRFSVEQPAYFDALTQAASFALPTERDTTSEALINCDSECMRLMVETLQRGVRDGSFSAERVSDPIQTAYYLRGALHGTIMEGRVLTETGVSHPSPEALVTYAIDMLARSMAP